jgi:uncharacterized membrane protein YqjE
MIREPIAEKPHFAGLLNKLIDQVLQFWDIKIALFKADLREESAEFLKGMVSTGLFLFVASVGFVLVSLSLVISLTRYVDSLPLSFLLVGSAFLILGTVPLINRAGRFAHSKKQILPETKEQLRKDKEWIKSQTPQSS